MMHGQKNIKLVDDCIIGQDGTTK